MSSTIENPELSRDPEQERFEAASRRAIRLLPLYLLVPLGFWLVFRATGYGIEWKAFGLGALGWVVALFLRGPISALAMKLPKDKAQTILIASSGVLEESIRLAVLAMTSVAFSWSVSVGQGWAAVEVLYVMINVVAIASLAKRTDEKAMQAKQFLQSQGTIQASPLWGILERVWASAFHIGCTLLVARYAWTVALLIPLHSSFNAVAVRLATKSVPLTGLFVAIVGVAVFAAGLLLF